MELDKHSLVFFLPFLLRMGLAPLFPVESGAAGLFPLVLSLGLFGILARRNPVGSPPPRWSAWLMGLAGAVLWVGICALDLERRLFPSLGLSWLLDSGARTFSQNLIAAESWAWMGKGLSLLIAAPLLEEFFFRGFVQRAFGETQWWREPPGRWRTVPLFVTTLLFSLLHGAEFFAAIAWFSWMSFVLARNRSLWDAVLLHAGTNFGLLSLVLGLRHFGWDLTRLL